MVNFNMMICELEFATSTNKNFALMTQYSTKYTIRFSNNQAVLQCRTAGPTLATSLEHLAHLWKVAWVFCGYYFGRFFSELAAALVPLCYSCGGPLFILTGCMILMSTFLDVLRMYVTVNFLAQIESLKNTFLQPMT